MKSCYSYSSLCVTSLSNDLCDYDFHLPEELIAQNPTKKRDASKLLIVRKHPANGLPLFEDALFKDLPQIVSENLSLKKSLWVRNRSFVIPARFYAKRATGSQHEIVLVHPLEKAGHWKALIKGQAKFKYPQKLNICGTSHQVISPEAECIHFPLQNERDILKQVGEMPLPPYIKERVPSRDKNRYQSIWADPTQAHSVAAPTASLHFTQEIIDQLKASSVPICDINLHVGLGTFQPLRHNSIDQNELHQEFFEINHHNFSMLKKHASKEFLCIGSTSLRCLESLDLNSPEEYIQSSTNIFIKSGYQFKYCKYLLTNFHLPKSSLLIMLSAFAQSRTLVLEAYQHAVKKNYRFFSYGDSSLWI